MKFSMMILAAALPVIAQEAASERLSIPFRDSSRPGMVRVGVLGGSITVKPHAGADVQVEATMQPKKGTEAPSESSGLRRIPIPGGLSAEEDNNVIRIQAGGHSRVSNVNVLVPARTSLKLSAVKGGQLHVENIEGDIEVNHVNGGITLNGISGSAVAHSVNGKIVVRMSKVDPSKPMSFSTVNGVIDVTLPADIKADIKVRTERGEIYSDFDITPVSEPPKVEANGEGKGRYRVRLDSGLKAHINGGGQEITFKTLNGSIFIRKGR
jgi:hypothetical protein